MRKTGYISGKRVKVAGDQITTATKLQRLTTPLLWITGSGDIGATELDLPAIMAAAGSEVPKGAIGIILQVEVKDEVSLPLLRLYKDASEINVAKHGYVQAQAAGVWINWQGIIELSDTNTIMYLTTNSTDMYLSLKLVGWIIAAE